MSRESPVPDVAPVLIVDDDRSVTVSLALLLKQAGFRSVSAASPSEALEVLKRERMSLVLQDMNFSRRTSGEEGLELLAEIKAAAPDVPVILVTAWGSIELAVRGIKSGAADFVTKPWSNSHLLQLIRTSLSLASSPALEAETRESLDERYDFGDIVGDHPTVVSVLARIARVCETDAPILILGESGTGKELVADAVHRNSRRRQGPLVKVNLGGVPATLFDSEMFGHVRGAFTDAKADRKGRFAAADTGTIFLDEIGDLDKPSQVKLLRVLQDRTYQPVGSSVTREADVRVVSATNRDLAEMVADGSFREDLLYRINLITIRLPALRERRSDVRPLVQHHLRQVAEQYRMGELEVEPEAYGWLETLDWPGNVRQLRQAVERAVLISGRRRLRREDFRDPGVEPPTPSEHAVGDLADLTLDEVEKLMVERSLSRHDNNISRAAADLGLSRAALYRRLEKHGIDV